MAKEYSALPVVTLYHNRLKKLVRRKSVEKILEMLPQIALDIEEQAKDYVRVEYNPNRPDFSTDYGIARALNGIFSIDKGLPKFQYGKSGISVNIDQSVNKVRPYVVALVAMNGKLDKEGIRQIISMQEDIHKGIGRNRKRISIGIHNYDVIKSPILYTTENSEFKFIPLNSDRSMSLKEISENTDVGRQYSSILDNCTRHPIIKDGDRNVLSFPPIINSELTKVTERNKNLFIEVTATDFKAAEDALAILAVTLYDAKFKINTVKVNYGRKGVETPNMKENIRKLKVDYVNKLLGLNLSAVEIVNCLQRSRIGAIKNGNAVRCKIPRYRTDVMHDIDLVEDIAIGYGIYRLDATYPQSSSVGSRDLFSSILDKVREVLIALGMIEVMNSTLVSNEVDYNLMNRNQNNIVAIERSKSIGPIVLRNSLLPSIIFTLSKNIHEPYPQRIFEVGKVIFANLTAEESWSIAVATAHKDADYTEARSYLQSTLQSLFNIHFETRSVSHPILVNGKSAEIILNNKSVGRIGEVNKETIDKFKMRVPISVFEFNISDLLKI